MNKMNIAVLFGSRSCEHDVSIISAMQLMEAAKTAGFTVTPIYISRKVPAALDGVRVIRTLNEL